MKKRVAVGTSIGWVSLLIASGMAPALSAEDCVPQEAVKVVAEGNAFDSDCYAGPADAAFEIELENKDPFSHNLSIYTEEGGETLFEGEYVLKGETTTYEVSALEGGSYFFVCDIHPIMKGVFLIGEDAEVSELPQDDLRAPVGPAVRLELVADGFAAPVFMTGAGDGSGRLFIVEQTGTIWIVDAEGAKLQEPFLDISDRLVELDPNYDERGLLGIAFHPEYEANGRFFVWYSAPLRESAPNDYDNTIVLAEILVSDDANIADEDSHRVLMEIDDPQSNHNSGHLTFGPDGYLYIPIGDGGAGNDVGIGHPEKGNGQDLTTILGNILRIDVDAAGEDTYGIPADNPYAGATGGVVEEIFASGFRNPYHISFDAGGDRGLYAADAGQDRYEEVSKVVSGGNYGWRIKEGTHCFSVKTPSVAPESCPDTAANGDPLIDPVLEYDHSKILGSVIIGGYIYRGSDVPDLEGRYVFGDYARDRLKPDGTLFAAETSSTPWTIEELRVTIPDDPDPGMGFGRFVLSFGQDDENELYVALTGRGGPEGESGAVYKLSAVESDGETPSKDEEGGGNMGMWIAAGIVMALAALWAVRRA